MVLMSTSILSDYLGELLWVFYTAYLCLAAAAGLTGEVKAMTLTLTATTIILLINQNTVSILPPSAVW
jgi:hypothetical protein